MHKDIIDIHAVDDENDDDTAYFIRFSTTLHVGSDFFLL